MPKRSRSTSQGRRRSFRPRRDSDTVMYTPRSTPARGRTMNRATSRARSLSKTIARSRSLSAGSRVLKMAGPYGRAAGYALDGYNYYTTAKRGYNDLFGKETQVKFSGSHSNAKSGGMFGKASYRVSAVDKHAKTGSIQKVEFGSVKTDAANQVTYLAQSTAPADTVLKAALASLLKKLFMANQVQIRSHDSLLLENCAYDNAIILWYRNRDNSAILQQTFAVPRASATLTSVSLDMFNFFVAFRTAGQVPDQYLRLQLQDNANSLIVSPVVVVTFNLTNCSFSFDAASVLKIQNRTINSAGNDTSEDVDNVPIFGKFYEYKTNGTIFNDYATTAGFSAVTTEPVYGILSTDPVNNTGTQMYKELPLQKQFAGCKKSGVSHLDPGEIKTSKITDQYSMSLQQLVKVLCSKVSIQATTGVQFTQYWIGKTRLFAWEKMINAVAMSATNQFNLAYEHQIEIGCTCSIKRDNLTAPSISIANSL